MHRAAAPAPRGDKKISPVACTHVSSRTRRASPCLATALLHPTLACAAWRAAVRRRDRPSDGCAANAPCGTLRLEQLWRSIGPRASVSQELVPVIGSVALPPPKEHAPRSRRPRLADEREGALVQQLVSLRGVAALTACMGGWGGARDRHTGLGARRRAGAGNSRGGHPYEPRKSSRTMRPRGCPKWTGHPWRQASRGRSWRRPWRHSTGRCGCRVRGSASGW